MSLKLRLVESDCVLTLTQDLTIRQKAPVLVSRIFYLSVFKNNLIMIIFFRHGAMKSSEVKRCEHKTKQNFRCKEITDDDILMERKIFYNLANKTGQDQRLVELLRVALWKRRRVSAKVEEAEKPKSCDVEYSFKVGIIFVPICKQLFMDVYQVTPDRLRVLSAIVKVNGVVKENR